jgi:hypothetical protein
MRTAAEGSAQRDLLELRIIKRRGMSAAQPLWLATTVCRDNAPLSRLKQAWFAMDEAAASLRT